MVKRSSRRDALLVFFEFKFPFMFLGFFCKLIADYSGIASTVGLSELEEIMSRVNIDLWAQSSKTTSFIDYYFSAIVTSLAFFNVIYLDFSVAKLLPR